MRLGHVHCPSFHRGRGRAAGALVGWGIPEEQVKHYESGITHAR